MDDKAILFKKARKKYFTNSTTNHLRKLNSPLKKGYISSYYCAGTLTQSGNKITTTYCKNRWCMVCNSIKTAQTTAKYEDELFSWGDDKYFVTLTIPNVKDDVLRITLMKMQKNFSNILRVLRERKKIDVKGIRKLECTYNPYRDDYHPHFHCIVKSKASAELIRSEWLKRYPEAELFCQDVRQCDEKSMKELFKYFTKIISDKKSKSNKEYSIEEKKKIYPNALDNIFQAIYGMRTFQNFGFKSKNIDKNEGETIETIEISEEIQLFQWENELTDWLNMNTGELLTGYVPSEKLKKILNDVDTQSICSQIAVNLQSDCSQKEINIDISS